MKKLFITCSIFFFLAAPALAVSWPASDQDGASIGGNLLAADPSFEPSGIAWHSGRNQYVLVGDEGQVATMDADGGNVTVWNLGSSYDLEGVAVADQGSQNAYVLDENTSTAFEFDLDAGRLTGKSWSFADRLSEVNGAGAEGLAWAEGAFYVGWQYDGDIYVYNVDLAVSQSQTFVEEIHMTSGYTDLSALDYQPETQRLYALYDGLNLLEERSLQGDLLASYEVPGSAQEGVALVLSCPSQTAVITIAEDSGGVVTYGGYPVACPQEEVEPSQEQTYLGYEISNDSVDNDGDGDVDEYNTLAENGVHPDYGTLDPYDTSLADSSLLGFSGLPHGDILVLLGDGAMYWYDAVPVTFAKALTGVRRVDATAFLVAWVGRQAAVLNGYTGEVVATTVFPRSQVYPLRWAKQVLGL